MVFVLFHFLTRISVGVILDAPRDYDLLNSIAQVLLSMMNP